MVQVLEPNEQEILHEWFKLDENQDPSTYFLEPLVTKETEDKWWKVDSKKVETALRKALRHRSAPTRLHTVRGGVISAHHSTPAAKHATSGLAAGPKNPAAKPHS